MVNRLALEAGDAMVTNATDVTEEDEGKKVVRGDETIGRVIEVRHGTAFVDPDPGLTETMMSKLGWAEASDEEGTYPLQEGSVSRITDDSIELESTL